MTENECYELLGFRLAGNRETLMTIDSLAENIIDNISLCFADEDADIRKFTPMHLGSTCLVLKNEDQLMFLAVDQDGDISRTNDARFLFLVLSAEGLLSSVAHPEVVAELERLRAEVVSAKLRSNEERERAEFERLKLKFGGF